jgi:uncharacterized membrane protein
METIIQAVFANETDAIAAQRALEKLDSDSDVSLGEIYVIGNDGHGNASVKSSEGETVGAGMAGGALLGSLLGLLGGPVGVLLGGSAGLLIGATGDLAQSVDMDDYLDDFAKKLQGEQTMLVAHLWEDAFAPVDSVLKPFGGQVTRLDVNAEIDKANQAEIDEINRKIDQAEADMAAANAADKAAFEAKIAEWKAKRDEINAKVKAKVTEQKDRYQTWLDNQRRKYEDWRIDVDEKERMKKREHLQDRIDKQEAKLAELREKEEAL